MDIIDYINRNFQKNIPNPNYNSRSKKSLEPRVLTVSDLDPHNDFAVDMAKRDFQNQYSIDSKDAEKYRREGLNWNPWENLDKQISDNQSAFSKIANGVGQAIVSEIGLGTVKGISDLFDMIGQATGISDQDYTNPLSQYLEEKQEEFRNWAPVYTDPDKHLTNGGLFDAGWWGSNIPSIMSSLTLLIPSTGVVKGVSYLGKAAKASSFTRKATRVLSGAERAIKQGKELSDAQRFINSSSTANAIGLFLENGATAALSRAIENYQEARQTYNDMYENAHEYLKNMSDEDYSNFVEQNKEVLESSGIDINDRDAAAKVVAKESADKTFQMDWLNVGFDVIEMYALRNAWKGLKNAPGGSASVRRANLDAAKYFGKTKAEIAEIKAARSFGEKAGEFIEDRLYGSKLVVGAQLSEGIEEAVNYVSQQEGMHLGNTMLGKDKLSSFDTRLEQYVAAPELWDAAFWGVMGGIVFQGLGSQFRRLSNKLTESKSDANEESQQELPWYKLDELPEIKRRKTEIEARGMDFKRYQENLNKIREGIDIYNSTKENEVRFDNVQEREAAERKLKNEYIASMTLRAMNSGNLDMLKGYLADDNVRKGMIQAGLFNENGKTKTTEELERESKEYIHDALNQIEKVERMYDEELIAVDRAASHLNGATKDRNKSSLFSNFEVPAEYMQIIAVNNVKAKLQIENVETELAAVQNRINELNIQFADDIDSNIDHERNIRVGVLTNELNKLYAQRKALTSQEGKSLSNQISIANIDKRIASIEEDLNAEELAYGTFMALQHKLDANGKVIQSTDDADLAQAFAYRDKLIVQGFGKGGGIVHTIEGLEHLSERARTSMSDDVIGKYQTLESDAKETFNSLRTISPELDRLYQVKAASNKAIDFIKNDIARTVTDVEYQVGVLHNTMNEARRNAIDKANNTIQDLYKKYGDDIRNALYDRFNKHYSDDWDSDTQNLTEEEKKNLSEAIDVLALSKSHNQSLVQHIEEIFDIQDMISAQQEVQNEENLEDEESQSSTIIENQNGEQQIIEIGNTPVNDINGQIQPKNGQIEQQNAVTDPQQTDSREPAYYTKFYTDKKGTSSGKHSKEDNGGVAVYDNEDGTFTIDVRNDPKYLNNPVFFSNTNEVDLTRPFEVESKPIAQKNNKGKLEIIEPGKLVNTDTLEYQQQKAEQETTSQQEPVNGDNNSVTTEPATSSTGELEQTSNQSATEETKTVNTETSDTEDSETATQASTTETKKQETLSNKSDEDVINQVPSDDAIKNESLSKIMSAARNDHDIDLDAFSKQLIDDYVAKGVDRTIAEKAVNWAAGVIKRKLEKLKNNDNTVTMRSSIDEILTTQSSLVELGTKKNPFEQAYKNAVKQLINQYAKENGITKVNDKIYINLENLLRYVNETSSDSSTATIMYNALKEYLKTDEAKESYITMDESVIDNNNFLSNVNKSSEERYNEIVGDDNVQRVDIQSYVSSLNPGSKEIQDFYDALDELQPDDALSTKIVGDIVQILDNKGRIVGTLPIPKIDATTGAYIMYNDGWKSDVLVGNNGAVTSRLKNLYERWLTSNNEDCKALNDIIFELAYTKPDQNRKTQLLTAFSSNPEIIAAKQQGYISSKASDGQLINGLVKLWRFTKPNNTVTNKIDNIRIKASLNKWFIKLNHSYNGVKALQNGRNLNISVASISDGELIRFEEKVTNPDNLPIASEAIAGGVNPEIHKIAIADKNNPGTLDVSGSKPIPFTGVGSANTFVILPNRSGRTGNVQAYPCNTSDYAIGQDAKDIIKAIGQEATNLFNDHANNPTEETYEALKNFLATALSLERGNTSLFRGVTVTIKAVNGNEAVSIAIPGTKQVIQFYKYSTNGDISSLVRINEGEGFKKKPFNDSSTIKFFKNNILNNLQFNISYSYIASDNVSDMHINGLATKKNGKFEIKIKDKVWVYNSFNEFILNNNLVRLNTKPSSDGRSNYNRRGERSQGGNQVFNIKLSTSSTTNTSSPVEESVKPQSSTTTPSTLTISQQAQVILDSTDTNQHKGLDIARLVFKENVLKSFENLDILPKSIIFDDKFNDKPGYDKINAEVNKKTGVVTVGTKWKALFDNPATREEAIRKLIHEQLHNKLTKKRGFVRSAKEIYNEFKDALNAGIDNEWYNEFIKNSGKSKKEVDAYFRQYLFEKENEDVALEEFLVETLTSSDLANLLNNIKAKEYNSKKGGKNFLQRVLELLSDVFGWGVRKGYLYEKELKTLRENFKVETTSETTETPGNKQDTKQTTKQPVQLPLNFEEETDDETINQEEPKTVPSTDNQTPSKFGEDVSDDLIDEFMSSVTELQNDKHKNDNDTVTELAYNAPSISSFTERLPIAQQPKFANLVANGEVSVSCR